MAQVAIDTLLVELGAEAPCGDNLEYSPEFIELERAILGKPEVQYGDTIVPAEPPDWKSVQALALGLSERTRDLRVAMHLTRALLATGGVAGLADGLALLQGLLARHWAQVHPQLDPDDDNDPTIRVNTVVALCDSAAVVNPFRDTPLVASRVHGRFSLRQIEKALAAGTEPPAEGQPSAVSAATVEAAFLDADLAELQATADALVRAAASLDGIETALTQAVGAARAVDLSALRTPLAAAQALVSQRLAQRQPDSAPAAAAAGGAAPARVAAAGEINSREDVIRLIDRICEYYARTEPASPVPLVLKRARRLVPMGFRELMADLAPDGAGQADRIFGVSE